MATVAFYRLALPGDITPEIYLAAADGFTSPVLDPTIDHTPRTAAAAIAAGPNSHGVFHINIDRRSIGEAQDAAADVKEALDELGARIPFAIHEQPREYPGVLVRHHPDHGTHVTDATADGDPLITATRLRFLRQWHPDSTDFAAQVDNELGTTWDDTTPTVHD